MKLNIVKKNRSFEGDTVFFEHESELTKTPMKFSAFIPSGKVDSAIIWLSGLTCTEENFITKSGAQNFLKNSNTMIICQDTSPRGLDLPGEHESYDFGSGAGFYVNATTEGYREHYQMYDYISKEIVEILKNNFDIDKVSIMGHSMGGHGALVLGLREKDLFKSVSAFSPIVNPLGCPWGQKALKGYLGEQLAGAEAFDATELVKDGKKHEGTILIDQGTDDEFLKEQLLTESFELACERNGQSLKVNYREGYDHSYFFISSFIEDHINFHLESLK